jgi:polysaccharide biosynthesis transport protein
MDARRYLAALRYWWWLPVVGVLAASAISYAVARQMPRVYEARTTVLVNVSPPQAAPTYNDALLSQQLVKTYTQMVVQPVVLEQVGPELGLDLGVDELERLVSAQPIRDTQLFTVTAQALQPEVARDVANTVAAVFIAQQEMRSSQGAVSSPISVIQWARLPTAPVEPKTAIDVAVAAVAGLLLSLGLVYPLAWADDTIKAVAEAERATGAPTLGLIPQVSPASRSGRALSIEAYRLLRTALDFASARQPLGALVVTSPGHGEGKSTVVANLAAAMAQAGACVVAVDADVRKPSLHHQFGLRNEHGLTDLLQHDALPREGLLAQCCAVEDPNLRVLTAGQPTDAATELLQSPRFGQLLEQLRREADVVILDSPPTLAVADALVVSRQADATLLVLAANATRSAAARRAGVALSRSGARLLGVVLNRAQVERDLSYALPGPDDEAAPRMGVAAGRAPGRDG